MRILIAGLYHTYNLGDPLLLECTMEEIKKHMPNVETEIVNVTGSFEMKDYQVPDIGALKKAGLKSGLIRFLSKYTPYDRTAISSGKDLKWEMQNGLPEVLDKVDHRKTDLVLFAGGQMFMHSFILPMQKIVRKCEEEQIPVIFHSCGFGPIESRQLQAALNQTLSSSCVSSVSVRDLPGRKELSHLPSGVRKSLRYSADMGLWASDVYPVSKPKGNVIGLGPVYTESITVEQEVYFFSQMIHLLNLQGIPWKIFTNGHPADECIAALILKRAGAGDSVNPEVPQTPQDLASCISSCSGIISCRLHSHIVAASYNVPSAAIVWDRKLPEFFKRAGVPERCFTFRNRPEDVLDCLKAAKEPGWDRKRIKRMKDHSLHLLLDQIRDSRSE